MYGTTRIGEQNVGAWAYHLPDGLGSVRQLADGRGAVTLARRYDPFGNALTSVGSGASVFGFAGGTHRRRRTGAGARPHCGSH